MVSDFGIGVHVRIKNFGRGSASHQVGHGKMLLALLTEVGLGESFLAPEIFPALLGNLPTS